MLLIYFIQKNN